MITNILLAIVALIVLGFAFFAAHISGMHYAVNRFIHSPTDDMIVRLVEAEGAGVTWLRPVWYALAALIVFIILLSALVRRIT